MSLTRSLSTIYEGDDDIDLLEFMQFRKNRDDISDDERDYEREDEEEQENAERVVKKRKFMTRVYEGYHPTIALNSEWYLKYVIKSRLPMSKVAASTFRRRFRMPYDSFISLVKEAREGNWFPDYENCNALG